jgi:hypothetical protein
MFKKGFIQMTVAAKIDSIQLKIDSLKKKKNELERKRSESLARLIQKCGLADLDENVLSGGLLSLANNLDSNKEEWRKAGDKFLRKNQRSTTQPSNEKDSKKTA